ncbi:MAG: L,D-transpeptidase [Verrucomicrobiae bacterium]|nr:L,D-transpeptidase [Verrucomicrobiae bacterium]
MRALLLVGIVAAGVWVWWNAQQLPQPAPAPAPPPTVATNPVGPPPPSPSRATPVTAPVPQSPQQPQPAAPTDATPRFSPMLAVTRPASPAAHGMEFPRPPRDVLEVQVALARRAISPGVVDGVMGPQTRAALLAFQRYSGLPETLALDAQTRARLLLDRPALTIYSITSNDLARLQPVSPTWLGKSLQTAIEYETVLELVAERGRASPNLIRRLNPLVDWLRVAPGTSVEIPDVTDPPVVGRAAFIVISLGEKKLQVFDASTNLLAHFPCSIAARVEKRPLGLLRVTAIAPNPNYTFDPAVFPESAEARQLSTKLILPPGPNNPVGTAWISLDRPGYGIHGTPHPEQVGRTESHGCFRLANWNAEFLLKLVWIGMPVYVEP